VSGITKREPARNGDEQDVVSTRARRIYLWTQRAGATAKAKRRIRRRERRLGKFVVREEWE